MELRARFFVPGMGSYTHAKLQSCTPKYMLLVIDQPAHKQMQHMSSHVHNSEEASMAELLNLRAVRTVSVIVAVAITAALAAPIFALAARVVA
jgi:hypothetical protein